LNLYSTRVIRVLLLYILIETGSRRDYQLISNTGELCFVNILVQFATGYTSLRRFMELRMKDLQVELLFHKQSAQGYCVWATDVKFANLLIFWNLKYLYFDIEINAAITLNCVGASMGEKPPLTKKLPATTTVKHQHCLSNVQYFKTNPSDYLFLGR